MRIPPVRVCHTKVSNSFTTSNPMNEYLQWRLNETPKTISEVTVHLIRNTKREKSPVIHSILHLSTKITFSTIHLVFTTRCAKYGRTITVSLDQLSTINDYTLEQQLVATTSEVTAGARGRHVVGVAVRTYVADQHTSSPAHPAGLLLLLQTLSADSRGNF